MDQAPQPHPPPPQGVSVMLSSATYDEYLPNLNICHVEQHNFSTTSKDDREGRGGATLSLSNLNQVMAKEISIKNSMDDDWMPQRGAGTNESC
jgi:hypothetical protein